MSSVTLGLAIDVFLMISLGMTIYYAIKLSGSLNEFKRAKDDLRGLMAELNVRIDEAQRAMKGLKTGSQETAEELQELIKESRFVANELKVGSKVSAPVSAPVAFPDTPSAPPRNMDDGPADRPELDDDMPSFFIQDRDFDDEDDAVSDDADVPENLQSQAERELFLALQKRRAGGGN